MLEVDLLVCWDWEMMYLAHCRAITVLSPSQVQFTAKSAARVDNPLVKKKVEELIGYSLVIIEFNRGLAFTCSWNSPALHRTGGILRWQSWCTKCRRP
jgi:hypothetical protein